MMKKLLVTLITATLFTFSTGLALAVPTTLISQGSEWQYQQFSQPDLWQDWGNVGLSSFDWANATWSTGNAGFGNGNSLPYNTYWREGTDLALQKTFTIPTSPINGDLILNVAADNGFVIFVNGIQIAKDNAEGYTSIWEYTLAIDNAPFLAPGENLIQVLAEDHGAKTFFDMKLSGDIPPVPEPGTILLLGAGLVGLAAWRRSKNR